MIPGCFGSWQLSGSQERSCPVLSLSETLPASLLSGLRGQPGKKALRMPWRLARVLAGQDVPSDSSEWSCQP